MVDNQRVEQRLLGLDLNADAKDRVADVAVRAHPKIDQVIAAMADEGWRVANIAAGFGNWIYVLFERRLR